MTNERAIYNLVLGLTIDGIILWGVDSVTLTINYTFFFKKINCVWLNVKYFPSVKYFRERKIFSSVWLRSKKCFGKYFLVFGCVAENDLCYHFYRVSHIFLRSKQILLQRIKIYKQHKKQKSKSQDQS